MAKIGQGDKRYEQMASSIGVLAAEEHGEWVRPWWHAWRWPVALLAGIVLWLTLVAIAGAAPPPGALAVAPVQPTSAQAVNPCLLSYSSVSAARYNAAALLGHGLLRTGFTPRRP